MKRPLIWVSLFRIDVISWILIWVNLFRINALKYWIWIRLVRIRFHQPSLQENILLVGAGQKRCYRSLLAVAKSGPTKIQFHCESRWLHESCLCNCRRMQIAIHRIFCKKINKLTQNFWLVLCMQLASV